MVVCVVFCVVCVFFVDFYFVCTKKYIYKKSSYSSFSHYNNDDNILPTDSALHVELTAALNIVHDQITPISTIINDTELEEKKN
jgi:hypothetical protein